MKRSHFLISALAFALTALVGLSACQASPAVRVLVPKAQAEAMQEQRTVKTRSLRSKSSKSSSSRTSSSRRPSSGSPSSRAASSKSASGRPSSQAVSSNPASGSQAPFVPPTTWGTNSPSSVKGESGGTVPNGDGTAIGTENGGSGDYDDGYYDDYDDDDYYDDDYDDYDYDDDDYDDYDNNDTDTTSSNDSGGGSDTPFEPADERQVNDPDGGDPQTIPTDVKNVAAGGIYADMVVMMGGNLVATSSDNRSNDLYRTILENIDDLQDYPKNGRGMTEEQAQDLADMPGETRPQAVIADSETFYDDDGPDALQILEDAQIKVLYMEDQLEEDVDSRDDDDSPFQMVLHNVYYVGQMLNDKCTKDNKTPNEIAQDFSDYYYDKIKNGLYDYYKNEPAIASFYAESFEHRPYNDDFERSFRQKGESLVIPLSLEEYNENVEESRQYWDTDFNDIPEGSKFFYNDAPYLYFGPNLRDGLENNFFTSALQMLNAWNSMYLPGTVRENASGTVEGYMKGYVDNVALKSWTAGKGTHTVQEWCSVVNMPFYPSNVIVGNQTDPPLDEFQLVTENADGIGSYTDYKARGISTPHVQPTGLHSWTGGSPESLLEPLWLASVLREESDVDMDHELRSFYGEFYHVNLSSSQMDDILYPDS